MSDLDDIMDAGGILWIFQLFIKGLGYLIVGVVFVLCIIVEVCKNWYQLYKDIKNGEEIL